MPEMSWTTVVYTFVVLLFGTIILKMLLSFIQAMIQERRLKFEAHSVDFGRKTRRMEVEALQKD